ncbi:hypothetical protein CBER1_10714 [Cercospora berteroae]|uniref:Uncharacterized protein n=1 Tax=Cercospora berteroae TaxID=357750 RepID=A0A2S6BYF9_9PEZI|nr:hypothetical protein CBER1_10714 [Cercospora berteroae]
MSSATQNKPLADDSITKQSSKLDKVKHGASYSLYSIINGFGGIHASPPEGSEKNKQKAIEKFERKEKERAEKKARKEEAKEAKRGGAGGGTNSVQMVEEAELAIADRGSAGSEAGPDAFH